MYEVLKVKGPPHSPKKIKIKTKNREESSGLVKSVRESGGQTLAKGHGFAEGSLGVREAQNKVHRGEGSVTKTW